MHDATNLKAGVTGNLGAKQAEKNMSCCMQNCHINCAVHIPGNCIRPFCQV